MPAASPPNPPMALLTLLAQDCWVLNKIAEDIFPIETPACWQRLRSRVKLRHRLSPDEYKVLVRKLTALSRKIEALCALLATAPLHQQPESRAATRTLLAHPWLNAKQVFDPVYQQTGLSYYQLYDKLRGRSPISETEAALVRESLMALKTSMQSHLDTARAEAKNYPFANGPGKASHRPATAA